MGLNVTYDLVGNINIVQVLIDIAASKGWRFKQMQVNEASAWES